MKVLSYTLIIQFWKYFTLLFGSKNISICVPNYISPGQWIYNLSIIDKESSILFMAMRKETFILSPLELLTCYWSWRRKMEIVLLLFDFTLPKHQLILLFSSCSRQATQAVKFHYWQRIIMTMVQDKMLTQFHCLSLIVVILILTGVWEL